MTVIALSNNAAIKTWEQSTTLDPKDPTAGMQPIAAVAYLFGQALSTISYTDTTDGVTTSDARFVFPPGQTQTPPVRVTVAELADALRYKYGIDPVIEFAPGIGLLRGYTVADVNNILDALNREFAQAFPSAFPIASTVSSAAVLAATQATIDAERVVGGVSFSAKIQTNEYDVAFSDDPNQATGTPVRVSATGGGLTAGDEYFVRNLGGGNYSFFTSRAAALGTASSNRVPLTSKYVGSVTVSFGSGIEGVNNATDDVTFKTNPKWSTGTRVRVNTTGFGFTVGVDYFIRNLNGVYKFFLTANQAYLYSSQVGRVNITGSPFGVQVTLGDYPPIDFSALLTTASSTSLTPATSVELRQDLTAGGDIYTNRYGAFYINGVPTNPKDLAVTSRLLAQDNMGAEYKTLMDGLSERNNLIAAARKILDDGKTGLAAAVTSLAGQYGIADLLSELTAGKYSDTQLPLSTVSTDVANDSVRFTKDPAWVKGTPVVFQTSGGGLTGGIYPEVYYVRPDGAGSYSFFDSQLNAGGNGTVGRVDLSSAIISNVRTAYFGARGAQITVAGDRYYDAASNTVGFTEFQMPGAMLNTGDELVSLYNIEAQISTVAGRTATRLRAGQVAYVKKLENGNFKIWNSFANRVAGGDEGLINFDYTTISRAFASVRSGTTQLFPDPVWANGAAVRFVSLEGSTVIDGGTIINNPYGMDYYARTDGLGNYGFYTSAAQATAPGAGWPTGGLLELMHDPAKSKFMVNLDGNLNFGSSFDDSDFATITALLNTLISNKTRDGDLDQAKLQSLTAQLQNNTEAMTALIKSFSDMSAALIQALR